MRRYLSPYPNGKKPEQRKLVDYEAKRRLPIIKKEQSTNHRFNRPSWSRIPFRLDSHGWSTIYSFSDYTILHWEMSKAEYRLAAISIAKDSSCHAEQSDCFSYLGFICFHTLQVFTTFLIRPVLSYLYSLHFDSYRWIFVLRHSSFPLIINHNHLSIMFKYNIHQITSPSFYHASKTSIFPLSFSLSNQNTPSIFYATFSFVTHRRYLESFISNVFFFFCGVQDAVLFYCSVLSGFYCFIIWSFTMAGKPACICY